MNNNFDMSNFLELCGLIFCFCIISGILLGITVWNDKKKEREKEALERSIENKVWYEVKKSGYDAKKMANDIENLKHSVRQNTWDILYMKQPPQIIEIQVGDNGKAERKAK